MATGQDGLMREPMMQIVPGTGAVRAGWGLAPPGADAVALPVPARLPRTGPAARGG
jgi:hypothetical protein